MADFLVNPNAGPAARYSFPRYIGQKVVVGCYKCPGVAGFIKKIEPYYTIVSVNGKEWVGTPTTMCPFEEYHGEFKEIDRQIAKEMKREAAGTER